MKGFFLPQPGRYPPVLGSLSGSKRADGEADRQIIPLNDAKQDVSNKPQTRAAGDGVNNS